MSSKLHDGEIELDSEAVRRLVASQFPRLAELPVTRVDSTGTVNGIYRLGAELYARLPRMASFANDLERELRLLPRVAAHVSLQVPEAVATGHPAADYPFTWAIYRWIRGQPYADQLVDDESRAAQDLARFVTQLREMDTSGAPRTGRAPLRELDDSTRAAIEAAGDQIDAAAAAAAWQGALDSPAWEGSPVWIHTDLLRPNLLVTGGRIGAVLDFGGVGIGDPAADVIAAWSVFGSAGRLAYRAALDVDDSTWDRARGYALHQAALIIPYYRDTNPRFVETARRTIHEVLDDMASR